MFDTMTTAEVFLVNTLFDLYLFVLVIRLILVWIRADYYNPISQFVITLTKMVINPLRKIIPNIKQFETSTFLLCILLEMLKFFLLGLLLSGYPNAAGLLLLALADLLKILLNTFFYAIMIQAIMSWVQPNHTPMSRVLAQITSPIINPIRRVMPAIGGIDLSAIPALILLQLAMIVLTTPLTNMGTKLAFG